MNEFYEGLTYIVGIGLLGGCAIYRALMRADRAEGPGIDEIIKNIERLPEERRDVMAVSINRGMSLSDRGRRELRKRLQPYIQSQE